MGHIVNPVGIRIGFNRFWNSVWVSYTKLNYTYILFNDIYIYKYINRFFNKELFYTRETLYGFVKILRNFHTLTLFIYLYDPLFIKVIGLFFENYKLYYKNFVHRKDPDIPSRLNTGFCFLNLVRFLFKLDYRAQAYHAVYGISGILKYSCRRNWKVSKNKKCITPNIRFFNENYSINNKKFIKRCYKFFSNYMFYKPLKFIKINRRAEYFYMRNKYKSYKIPTKYMVQSTCVYKFYIYLYIYSLFLNIIKEYINNEKKKKNKKISY